MNLSQRGLLRAQTNALKAVVPELDLDPPLTRNAQPIGNGYMLLTARDDKDHTITDVMQIHALIKFFTKNGEPERIRLGGTFSLQRWSRLKLPNGQTTRSAWKEIENEMTRSSRNVKVCTLNFFISIFTTPSVSARSFIPFWGSPVLLPGQGSRSKPHLGYGL
jgi:hypothetical protein